MRKMKMTLLATTAAALLAGITFAGAQDAGREHGTAGAQHQPQPNRQGSEGARSQGQEQKAQPQRQGQAEQPKAQPQRQGQNEKGKQGQRETRSEEHTSELQSLAYLVCRLLLEKT